MFVARIVCGTRNLIQSERTSVEYVEQRRNIMAALCRSISSDPIEMKQKMISVSIVGGSVCAHSTHYSLYISLDEKRAPDGWACGVKETIYEKLTNTADIVCIVPT